MNNQTDVKKKRPAPKRRTSSLMTKKLMKELPKAKSVSDAMRKAGYSENYINSGARRETLQSPTIVQLMDKLGLSDEFLLTKLKEGTDAKKVIAANVIIQGDSGPEMKEACGLTRDFIEVDDFPTRHKYVETGLKIKGHLRDKVDIDLTVDSHEERMKRMRGGAT